LSSPLIPKSAAKDRAEEQQTSRAAAKLRKKFFLIKNYCSTALLRYCSN
jgi:hypothetical protein